MGGMIDDDDICLNVMVTSYLLSCDDSIFPVINYNGKVYEKGYMYIVHIYCTVESSNIVNQLYFQKKNPLWSQEISGVTGKFGLGVQNEAGQRLIDFSQENKLVIENTLFQQHKRRLYTWTSPDGQHQNQIDYILCSQRWRSSIQSAKTRPKADCDSDHDLVIAKFRLQLRKIDKPTRLFRYNLHQIPNDYTVDMNK